MIDEPNLNIKPRQIVNGTNLDCIVDKDLLVSPTITQTANTLKNINVIKDELCKLPLDTCELDYVNNNVLPLLSIIYQLSTTAFNLANSSNILSVSSVVHPKRHELKESVHLAYKINEECEDVYDVLKKRINFVLKNAPEK